MYLLAEFSKLVDYIFLLCQTEKREDVNPGPGWQNMWDISVTDICKNLSRIFKTAKPKLAVFYWLKS